MIQVKVFTAENDTQINAILKQVPDEAFVKLELLGQTFSGLGSNAYMLTLKSDKELSIDTSCLYNKS